MKSRTQFTPRLEVLDDRAVPSAAGFYALGTGPGGPPRVQVYETGTGTKIIDFLPFENTFTGGVTTAMGDVNNDGIPDLIVGAGNGGGPRVRIFNGADLNVAFNPNAPGAVLADFFAFEDSQRGGVTVTTGNYTGGLFADVVVGAGPGGGPRVRVLNGQAITSQGQLFTSDKVGDVIADFFAFESTFRNGVTVAANTAQVSLSSFSDLAVAPGPGGAPRVRLLNGASIATLQQTFTSFGSNDVIADFFAGDPNSRAGLFVANADVNGDGLADVITGTGAGIPGLVTVYNGSIIRIQRTSFTGAHAGDQIDSFAPLADYANGVTVGSASITGTPAPCLLYGTGGEGFVSDSIFSRYVSNNGFSSRQVVYDRTFDSTLFIGVNASN